MKKLILIPALVMSSLLFGNTANAQIGFHINLHFGSRPEYVEPAPVPVNDEADFYYLPDVAAYYSVRQNCYYYNDGYNWVSATCLPGRYHDYDWQHARRFVVNNDRPYMHDDDYRARYHGNFEGHANWGYRDEHHDDAYRSGGYQRDNRDNHGYRDEHHDDAYHGGGYQTDNHSFQQYNGGRGGYQQPQQSNQGHGNDQSQRQDSWSRGDDHHSRGDDNRSGDRGWNRQGRF